ncbi:MAG: hypothetical protein WD029_01975 [Microthrixaceae bacterium]
MNVSTLIFLGLAVVWAIVLLPEVLRKLALSRRTDSISSFNQQLSVLDRSGNRRGADLPGMPRPLRTNSEKSTASSSSATGLRSNNVIDLRDRKTAGLDGSPPKKVSPAIRRRRQDVLVVLASVAMLMLLCTVAFGSVFLVPFVLSASLLVGYLILLNQSTQSAGVAQPSSHRNGLVPASSLPSALQSSTVGRPRPAPRRVAN